MKTAKAALLALSALVLSGIDTFAQPVQQQSVTPAPSVRQKKESTPPREPSISAEDAAKFGIDLNEAPKPSQPTDLRLAGIGGEDPVTSELTTIDQSGNPVKDPELNTREKIEKRKKESLAAVKPAEYRRQFPNTPKDEQALAAAVERITKPKNLAEHRAELSDPKLKAQEDEAWFAILNPQEALKKPKPIKPQIETPAPQATAVGQDNEDPTAQ